MRSFLLVPGSTSALDEFLVNNYSILTDAVDLDKALQVDAVAEARADASMAMDEERPQAILVSSSLLMDGVRPSTAVTCGFAMFGTLLSLFLVILDSRISEETFFAAQLENDIALWKKTKQEFAAKQEQVKLQEEAFDKSVQRSAACDHWPQQVSSGCLSDFPVLIGPHGFQCGR